MNADAYLESGYYIKTIDKPSKKYKMVERFFKKHNVKRVLDLGCGAGRHTYLLAKAGFEVYGLDISDKALRINKSILKKMGLKAKLIKWDILDDLPYENEFFDAVFASRVMYQFKKAQIKKIIEEVARVLKRKGYLFWEGPTYKTTKEMFYGEKLKLVEPGTWLSIGGPFHGQFYHRFKDKQEVSRLLKDFKIIRFDFRGKSFSLIAQKENKIE